MGSPVDKEVQDALDRLEKAGLELWPPLKREWAATIATVRQELQRLREERDAARSRVRGAEEESEIERENAEAAEAEVTRLTNKLNEDSQNFEIECLKAERDRLEYRVKAAEAENRQLHADALAFDNVREAFDDTLEANTRLARESNERLLEISRLREGLREIAEWDGRSAEIHGNRGVREYARALLADSPTDGGERHAEGLDERGIYGGRAYPDGGGA